MTRPEDSLPGLVNPHPEITMLLRSRKEMRFQLPWVNGDYFNKFWGGLMGKDRNRKGWLYDCVRNYYSLFIHKTLISICHFVILVIILFMVSNRSTSRHGLRTCGT